MRVRTACTEGLPAADLAAVRALMDVSFEGGFTDDDMDHALGGWHVLLEVDGRLVSHAAVVPRDLDLAGARVRAGYVEAVATHPSVQGRGYGTAAMRAAADHVRSTYQLGALSTGEHAFYERLGWERWRGATFVRHPDGMLERTPEEDDGIMVLRVDASVTVDPAGAITCDWRPGDAW